MSGRVLRAHIEAARLSADIRPGLEDGEGALGGGALYGVVTALFQHVAEVHDGQGLVLDDEDDGTVGFRVRRFGLARHLKLSPICSSDPSCSQTCCSQTRCLQTWPFPVPGTAALR